MHTYVCILEAYSMLMFKGFALYNFWINSNYQNNQQRVFLKQRSLLNCFVDFFGSLIPKGKYWALTCNFLRYGCSLERICNKVKMQTRLVTMHKKWSFPFRISSLNVTKSSVNCRFGHISWKILNGKLNFLWSVT